MRATYNQGFGAGAGGGAIIFAGVVVTLVPAQLILPSVGAAWMPDESISFGDGAIKNSFRHRDPVPKDTH